MRKGWRLEGRMGGRKVRREGGTGEGREGRKGWGGRIGGREVGRK